MMLKTAASDRYPVFEHWHVASDSLRKDAIDGGASQSDTIRYLCYNLAPWITNQRVAIGEACLAVCAGVGAPGSCSGKPALGLDGTGPDQRFPVIFSGLQGEGRGQKNKLCAGSAKVPKHVGEADVITYRTTHIYPINVEGHDGNARNLAE